MFKFKFIARMVPLLLLALLSGGVTRAKAQSFSGYFGFGAATDKSNGQPLEGAGATDANGNFIKELISPGGQLDDPWGIVMAPASFGNFSSDLLVGNFGNGEINAFNPTTGAFLATLDGTGGTPLVNQDLWALAVTPTAPDAVYFTAGINGQRDGLFGDIVASPEPGSLALVVLSSIALGLFSRRKSWI